MNKYFCSLPWTHLRLDASGQTGVSPCCWYDISYLHKVDPDHPSHSYVQKHGLKKAMNQKAFKQIRKNMLNGVPTKGCFRCYDEEKLHGFSMRTAANDSYVITDQPLTEDFLHTKFIEISLDNTCNLECKMCSSRYSTKLRRRDDLIGNKVYPNIVYDPTLLDDLDLNHVEKIKFLGGEPLLSKHHLPFLKKFPMYNKLTLLYNTNATMLPSHEAIEIMKQVKSMNFIISCDGIYKYNDYQRWGSKFETVIENGLKIKDTFKNIQWFTFLNTFTLLNLNAYAKTVSWFKSNNIETMSNWEQGGTLSAWHSPDWYEEWILKENNYPEVRNYFKRRKYNPDKWQQFLDLIKITDQMYNTKLEDYNPELAEQLKIHKQL